MRHDMRRTKDAKHGKDTGTARDRYYTERNYAERHWNIFLRSIRPDALTFKLFITDILFILTIILAYAILHVSWVKNLVSISSILGVEENMPAISNLDILGLWNSLS